MRPDAVRMVVGPVVMMEAADCWAGRSVHHVRAPFANRGVHGAGARRIL